MSSHFTLPIYIDLTATCLYAMTGALLAIRRHYDVIGLFVLALVSGVGGGLIRDGIFIQHGPPLAISDGRYLAVVILGCIAAALFLNHLARLQTAFLFADALGLGCYAVVGVEHALNAQLPIRDRDHDRHRDCLWRRAVARRAGERRTAPVQTGTALRARRLDWSKPVYVAYLVLQDAGSNSSIAGDWLLLCLSHARHCLRLENSLGVTNIT